MKGWRVGAECPSVAVWAAVSPEIANRVEGGPWQEDVRSHDNMSAHPYPHLARLPMPVRAHRCRRLREHLASLPSQRFEAGIDTPRVERALPVLPQDVGLPVVLRFPQAR